MTARRTGSLVLAFVNLAGALVVMFFGLVVNGLRCDDNCSIAPGWRNDPSAWQWSAEFGIAVAILVAAVLLNVVVWMTDRPPLRWLPVLVQIGAIVFLTWLAQTAVPGRSGGWDWVVALFIFFGITGAASARSPSPP